MKWLINKENESTHQQKVISIVGYGGLGKTTLARQVYDKIGENFECRAFVSISRTPEMSKILSSVLCQLRNQGYTHGGDVQLIIDQIRDFLKDKRYVSVVVKIIFSLANTSCRLQYHPYWLNCLIGINCIIFLLFCPTLSSYRNISLCDFFRLSGLA